MLGSRNNHEVNEHDIEPNSVARTDPTVPLDPEEKADT